MPLRPFLSLAFARAANTVVPARLPVSLVDRVRWRLTLVLIDASLRVGVRPKLSDELAELTTPPTLRSRVNAPGGRS